MSSWLDVAAGSSILDCDFVFNISFKMHNVQVNVLWSGYCTVTSDKLELLFKISDLYKSLRGTFGTALYWEASLVAFET